MVHLGNDWDELLKEDFQSESYQQLRQFLISEYRSRRIYPSMYDIFNALKYTPYAKVKVVILGQDPYHEPGQAHGLCFSVLPGVRRPPSLENIFKELAADVGFTAPAHGYLRHWAESGVLLLNAVLTVREGQASSHKGKGWEQITDRIIEILNKRADPMVFLLWGAQARAKMPYITNPHHLVLTAAHPSPLSAHNGFFGCRHFSRANRFLIDQGSEAIDWQLPEKPEI
ncbi:MAG TPA: uracil-DNA glycosylase [Clostridiales bacterium]|jgi:uracil-DNA glycosylase|nr:uracil-DNA glycosylase [Clostridiales bacterium]